MGYSKDEFDTTNMFYSPNKICHVTPRDLPTMANCAGEVRLYLFSGPAQGEGLGGPLPPQTF